jgi:hypothetical protein
MDSLGPAKPDGRVFWGYSLAYRLSEDPVYWSMARQIMVAMGYGDPGEPDGPGHTLVLGEELVREMERQTGEDDWREPVYGLYAVLELYQATGSCRCWSWRWGSATDWRRSRRRPGLFPRGQRLWARTGDEVPLALLHLTATLAGNRDQLPRASIDSATFHVRYSGDLEPHQRKPGDARTTDCRVFYGQ